VSNINYDVISKYKSEYCHAKLPPNGMIDIEKEIFHKDYQLSDFPEAYTFSSFKAAKVMLPDDLESFIMEFEGKYGCERFWFSEKQVKSGLIDRLNFWKTCYEKYKISIYK